VKLHVIDLFCYLAFPASSFSSFVNVFDGLAAITAPVAPGQGEKATSVTRYLTSLS
jgi:hypothetical protein